MRLRQQGRPGRGRGGNAPRGLDRRSAWAEGRDSRQRWEAGRGMDYLSVQALAGTAVSRIEGSLGEIPKVKSSLKVRRIAFCPRVIDQKQSNQTPRHLKSHKEQKRQERHTVLGRSAEDLRPIKWFGSLCQSLVQRISRGKNKI